MIFEKTFNTIHNGAATDYIKRANERMGGKPTAPIPVSSCKWHEPLSQNSTQERNHSHDNRTLMALPVSTIHSKYKSNNV